MTRSAGQSYLKSALLVVFKGVVVIFSLLVCMVCMAHCSRATELTIPIKNLDIGTLPNIPYQDITLTTADGLKLLGWYVPGTKPDAIIIVHGFDENRAYMIPQAVILARAGYHLLLFDLRGHGLSEGDMVTFGSQEALDVEAAVNYLAALPDVKHIGALGDSLGGAAVVRAAVDDPRLQALVIQNGYSSFPAIIQDDFNGNFNKNNESESVLLSEWFYVRLIRFNVAINEYRTGVDLKQINPARDLATMSPRPVFIIHSPNDVVFPLYHAQKMYDAARGPKDLWIIDKVVGHINPIVGHEVEYQKRILKFFEKAFAQ